MTHEERMNILKTIVIGFGKMLGDETEIVLHDLTTNEIAYIVNGHITGRDTTYSISPSVRETIVEMVDDDGCLIGYGSGTLQGHKLKASHLIIRDEEGNPDAMICVNQDVTQLENVISYLGTLVRMQPLSSDEESGDEEPNDGETYIQRITKQAILDAIDRSKPTDLSSREAKLKILGDLKSKGIFDVKDAVPYVCSILNISQATLYNYLRDLRNEDVVKNISHLRRK